MDPDAVKRGLDHCLVAGALLATLGIVTTVTIQILARLFWTSAPAWTEEAARFFLSFRWPLAPVRHCGIGSSSALTCSG